MVSAPNPKLSDMLNVLPAAFLSREVRPLVRILFDEMDQLLFLDNMGELSVDRGTLIRIASDDYLMPARLRDIAILETSKHLGPRVKAVGEGRRITWREGEKYGLPIHPPTLEDFRAWGITDTTSIDELGVILKAQLPGIPEFWFNENSAQLEEMILQKCMANQTFWDCLVANLGWWAAIVAVGAIVVFFALVGEIGWQAALVWAIVYSGVATFYFIAQCLVNPSFRQF
jgi:hypothetical protein